ncbi:MAG: hypothetical protein ACKV0T_14675 [Planctomycetales bacterium]
MDEKTVLVAPFFALFRMVASPFLALVGPFEKTFPQQDTPPVLLLHLSTTFGITSSTVAREYKKVRAFAPELIHLGPQLRPSVR